jgi:hypothetical protein
MTTGSSTDADLLDRDVRMYVFGRAAETRQVPTPAETAQVLDRPQAAVEDALRRLATARALILAPGTTNIWAANPFCAVPSGFRVEARGQTYWGICIWDALGIPAALRSDAVVHAECGDCGEELVLEIGDSALARSTGVIHFGVPAARWWENIAFT